VLEAFLTTFFGLLDLGFLLGGSTKTNPIIISMFNTSGFSKIGVQSYHSTPININFLAKE